VGLIQIRGVPDDVHRTLKARAATRGVSLSDYLLAEVVRVARVPEPEELDARIRARGPAGGQHRRHPRRPGLGPAGVTSVIDASGVVVYLLGEGSVAEHGAVVSGAHAPSLVDIETMQTLRGLVRGGGLGCDAAGRAHRELGELSLRRHPDAALLARAWELARRLHGVRRRLRSPGGGA
jgi:plasmid stability protein